MYNKDFLYELDNQQNRAIYVRIIALNKDEQPIQQIQGRATGGSVNIDGNSSVRRTCSLTMVTEPISIIDAYWALKSKFKLEVGVSNKTKQYTNEPIIWFKMGTFGINAFSKQEGLGTLTLNISGQDKMSFLNGTLGGNLTASVNFGEEEFINKDNSVTLRKVPIYDIIQKGVYTYGNESMNNIIIRDLDNVGYELWDFKGGSKEAMYIFYSDDHEILNVTFNGDMTVNYEDGQTFVRLKDLTSADLYHRNELGTTNYKTWYVGTQGPYRISKIQYGEAAGYHQTPLVYAGDLIVNAGQPFTEVLDKIKTMLGEYEYFYDVDGRFIFQKKQTYVKGLVNFDNSIPITSLSEYSYKFNNEELINQISFNPTVTDVKNDLTVWGTKKSLTGVDLASHARVAIQNKPTKYVAFDGNIYEVNKSKTYTRYRDALVNAGYQPIIINDDYLKVDEDFNFEIEFKISNMAGITSQTVLLKAEDEKILTINNSNILFPFEVTTSDGQLLSLEDFTPNDVIKIRCFNFNNAETKKKDTVIEIYKNNMILYTAEKKDQTLNTKGYLTILPEGNSSADIHLYELKLYRGDALIASLIPDAQPVEDIGVSGIIYDGNTRNEKLKYEWAGLFDIVSTKFFPQTPSLDENKNLKYIEDSGTQYTANLDWRELIYQMAKDYMDHHDEYDFNVRLAANNAPMYQDGRTGYEQYYTDILGFWRTLYWVYGLDEPAAASFNPSDYLPSGWHINKEYSPESLLFWFDLLEPASGLGPFSVETIGSRTKVDNNKSAKSIYLKETPDILFEIKRVDKYEDSGVMNYTIIPIGQQIAENVFSMSTQGTTILQALDDLIYKHVVMAEGISLTTIPIYHIEPNTRIYLNKTDSDYVVTQMSIPLTYNGTMSITATKVLPIIT